MCARINFFFLNHLIKQDAKYFQTWRHPLFTAVRVVHLNQSVVGETTPKGSHTEDRTFKNSCFAEIWLSETTFFKSENNSSISKFHKIPKTLWNLSMWTIFSPNSCSSKELIFSIISAQLEIHFRRLKFPLLGLLSFVNKTQCIFSEESEPLMEHPCVNHLKISLLNSHLNQNISMHDEALSCSTTTENRSNQT